LPADPKPPIDIVLDPKPGTIAITGYPPTITGAVPVDLEKEADRVGVSVADHVALQDANLRQSMARGILGTFIGANLVTLAGLSYLAWLDQSNLASKLIAPGERIVSGQVIMALLGATTVQVGAIMVIIARYLFPGRA
jgi:hypothetical protein